MSTLSLIVGLVLLAVAIATLLVIVACMGSAVETRKEEKKGLVELH